MYSSLSVALTLPIPLPEKSPMEWTRHIDGYCERLDPGYWAEPINAVTNAAFLLVALIMWRRLGDASLPLALVLVYIYAANRAFWRKGRLASVFGVGVAIALSVALIPVLAVIPLIGVSASYLPLPLLIAGYGLALRPRAPDTARGLWIGAGLDHSPQSARAAADSWPTRR